MTATMDEVDPAEAPATDEQQPVQPGPVDVTEKFGQFGVKPVPAAQLSAESAAEAERAGPVDVTAKFAQFGVKPIPPAQMKAEFAQQQTDTAKRVQAAAPIDVTAKFAQFGVKPVPREAFDEPPSRTGLPEVPGRPGSFGAPQGPQIPMQKLWMPGPTYALDPTWNKQHPQASLGEPQPGIIDTVTSGIKQMLPALRKATAGQISDRGEVPEDFQAVPQQPTEQEKLDAAAGASKLIGVGMDAAMAVSGGAMLAQPVKTIIGIGKYMAAKYVIDQGLQKYGVAKEYADLISTFGGMLGAAGEIRETIDRKIAEHNATAEDLVMKDRVEGIWNTLRQMGEDQAKAKQQAKEAATSGARPAPPEQGAPPQEPIATVTRTEPQQAEPLQPIQQQPQAATPAEPLTTLPENFAPGQKFEVDGQSVQVTQVLPKGVSFTVDTPTGPVRRTMPTARFADFLGLPPAGTKQQPAEAPATTPPTPPPAERPQTVQTAPQPAPAEAPKIIDLTGMGEAIGANLRDALWEKVQAGDITEGGQPSAILQAAKMARDRGGLQSREDFEGMVNEYAAIPRDQNFQQAMHGLVQKYAPQPLPPQAKESELSSTLAEQLRTLKRGDPFPEIAGAPYSGYGSSAELQNAIKRYNDVNSAPAATPGTATLPHDLRGARPRYNYGSKAFELKFESDIDRAAYITAQEKPSKRDADYLKFAQGASGASEEAVRAHGARVRGVIKQIAKTAEAGTAAKPAMLQVPNQNWDGSHPATARVNEQ